MPCMRWDSLESTAWGMQQHNGDHQHIQCLQSASALSVLTGWSAYISRSVQLLQADPKKNVDLRFVRLAFWLFSTETGCAGPLFLRSVFVLFVAETADHSEHDKGGNDC